MNKIKTIGLAVILLAGGIGIEAQTSVGEMPPLPSINLTNLPTTTLGNEKIGISTGPLMHGASTFSDANIVDYNINTNFFARAEGDITTSSSVVDALGAGPGIQKVWSEAKIYAAVIGRRNWDTATWEAVFEPGIVYNPSTNSVLQDWSFQFEPRLVITGDGRPDSETFIGFRYSF